MACVVSVAKPAIIKEEEIYSEFAGLLHTLSQLGFVKVEVGILPIIEQTDSRPHAVFNLILSGPVMEVARSLTSTSKGDGKDKLGGNKLRMGFQRIV